MDPSWLASDANNQRGRVLARVERLKGLESQITELVTELKRFRALEPERPGSRRYAATQPVWRRVGSSGRSPSAALRKIIEQLRTHERAYSGSMSALERSGNTQ